MRRMLTRNVVATMLVLGFGIPPTTAEAEPTLRGANAEELERLLEHQHGWKAVPYSSRRLSRIAVDLLDRYLLWNEIALDTTAIDHTPADKAQGEDPRRFGQQLGPHRSSYAMAIVHIAMFDAFAAITGKYATYTDLPRARGHVSANRAVAQAAHDTLVALYPYQAERIEALFEEDISKIEGTKEAIEAGAELGRKAAQAILAKRENDGSSLPEPRVGVDYFPKDEPGVWQPDPVSKLQVALGGNWAKVKPFVLASADELRPAEPPKLTDNAYTEAYREVWQAGGDPTHGSRTSRTEEETFKAVFWAYDGTPSLCAPPRLYNQIARAVALKNRLRDPLDMARLLALVNVAMADAGIAAWEAKYHYRYWRPVTGIRAGDEDGNRATYKEAGWYPLGAPSTNSRGPNFTPPFPAYPSGHATFGGALFQILRKFWPDDTRFTVVSDEFNGKNLDISGVVRPLRPASFRSFSEAEHDNAQSRIWMGVHWQFDAGAGIKLGNAVADRVYAQAFRPVEDRSR